MIKERISMDTISKTGCSIKIEKYIENEGMEFVVGSPFRISYTNSESGRLAMERDYPEYFSLLVSTLWGDSPIVNEQDV